MTAGNCLLIFAKSPEMGKVKTRIAESVGSHKAVEIYEEMLGNIIKQSAADEQWERWVYITPESDAPYFQRQDLCTMFQRGNNIGERMGNAFAESFHRGAEKVILVGSDIPSLTRCDILSAFEKLDEAPAVIGPSEDGGFYLFGLRREYALTAYPLFNRPISWSTPTVLMEMKKWCGFFHLPILYLPQKKDIDTYEDWVIYQKVVKEKLAKTKENNLDKKSLRLKAYETTSILDILEGL